MTLLKIFNSQSNKINFTRNLCINQSCIPNTPRTQNPKIYSKS